MTPCGPQMSNAAWRRWIGLHPHHAPFHNAPCGGKAAIAKMLGGAAIAGGLAAGGVAAGYHAPSIIASLPPLPTCCAWSTGPVPTPLLPPSSSVGHTPHPVRVPEPSTLLLLAAGVAVMMVVRR